MIPEGKKAKRPKVKVKEKTVLLIDEDGTNLGEMDGSTATKLSESKGLKIVLVSKETPERCAVYKLMSGKQVYEEEKLKKQKLKKDPRQVTKEITVSTRIGEHDLEVKLSHMKEFLSNLHNVRLVIEPTRVPRFADDREEILRLEKEKQLKMVEEIEKSVAGVGTKMAKENIRRNKLQCTFRSAASQDTLHKT